MNKKVHSQLVRSIGRMRNTAILLGGLAVPAMVEAQSGSSPGGLPEIEAIVAKARSDRRYQEFKPGYPVTVMYSGNKKKERLQDPSWDDKLYAIAGGIVSVENAFNRKLVDSLDIVENSKIHNALAPRDTRRITFFSKKIDESSSENLTIFAEHETLHQVVRTLGYRTGSTMKLFEQYKDDAVFTSFINESEYYNFDDDSTAGHSYENVEEFLTSFIHSVVSIDKLEENIKKLDVRNNKNAVATSRFSTKLKFERINLDNPTREHVLAVYKHVLAELIALENQYIRESEDDSERDHHQKNYSFFENALSVVECIKW